jgi:hypothetical protein
MADGAGERMATRLAPFRGRLALAAAAEDLQPGLAAGAAVVLLAGVLRYTRLLDADPGSAVQAGLCLALAFPAAGLLFRRTSTRRVANLVDERLGLAERVGTALALETGEAPATPLAGLVAGDADRSLSAVPAARLDRAFRPRALRRPLLAAGAAALLALFAFRMDPLPPAKAGAADPAAAYREKKEKEDVAKAARKVLEEAKAAEQVTDPRHAALKAVAAEMRRRAEEMLRQNPNKVEAMAAFQKMGELARERQELLAGIDPEKLRLLKDAGELQKMDPDLARLLSKLLSADLKGLNDDLGALDRALKGEEGSRPWTAEEIAALKDRIDRLADELRKNEGTLADREALRRAMRVLGDEKLLRELSERMARLMETLREQGWEPCKSAAGLGGEGGESPDGGDTLELTDEQLQAMIDRMKELQELAELGLLATCQNCGLSGGT